MSDSTEAWRHYVATQITRSEKRMLRNITGAVGEILAEERRHRAALEAEVRTLRELVEERGAKLRSVSPPKIA